MAIALAILELLAFTTQNFKASHDPRQAPFEEKFSGIMKGFSLGACAPNLKFISSAVLELSAFNAENLRGHVMLATPPFMLLTFGGWRPPSDIV